MNSLRLARLACIVPMLLGIAACATFATMSDRENLPPAEEPILWLCQAESSSRSYKAQLDRAATQFALEVYSGSTFAPEHYLETVQITVEPVGQRQLTGYGQTSADASIQVRGFGGNIEFYVEDSTWGNATGRCERIGDLN